MMSIFSEIKDNLKSQICELESLQAVYPTELIIADHGILVDIKNFINGAIFEIPHRLEYTVNISILQAKIEIQVSLSSEYPKKKPEIYVRSSTMNRGKYGSFIQALNLVIESQIEGEPCIYALILWVQDNVEMYLNNTTIVCNEHNFLKQDDTVIEFARYWVYSHHIYSKLKRKDIHNIAKENSLTGFCLAGKPGIICVEGAVDDCEYWWQQIKSMNWHRILIKLTEKYFPESLDDCRKFSDFEDISFPTFERHNDMGRLFKYLTEHDSQHVFKEFFGVEGKFAFDKQVTT